jgi:apolipoprotein N-acyltransferase
VALVPWLIAICADRSALRAFLGSYLLGAAFFLFHFRWLCETTPEGYVAASLLYLALAFPLAAWPIRSLYRRRRIGLAVVVPVACVGVDILRAYNPLGFPWFFLGHSQIRLLPMVQIADLTGAYGVTFVLGMVNGLIADLLLARLGAGSPRPHRPRPGPAVMIPVTLGVLAGAFGYGSWRLSQSQFTPGPRTAVLQGDFLLRAMINDPEGASEEKKEQTYLDLIDQAVKADPGLRLIVLPETPWTMVLNREFRESQPAFAYWHRNWVGLVQQLGKSVVVGSMAEEPQPRGTYPAKRRYNSAFLYNPGESEPQRYNKIHLVPFGEYVPFRYSRYFHWLYRFFAFGPFNPWGRDGYEYSLDPGSDFTVMKLPQAADGRNGRFGVTICYEDVVPQLFRRFVAAGHGSKRVDFMLNISNDGWFGHGTQQGQHLVNCAFRAIENRVGVARAANTGISGFVDPDGRWRDLVQGPGRPLHAGGVGFRVADVSLDPRVTFYSLHGDVFGFTCLALTLAGLVDSVVAYRRLRRLRTPRIADPAQNSRDKGIRR